MQTSFLPRQCCAVMSALLAAIALGQTDSNPVEVRAVAEVEVHVSVAGRVESRLVAADRVVPGDHVIYTLEVRNTRATSVPAPTVTYAIPAHMQYIANSAAGPGAQITYSVDGGQRYDSPENLQVAGAAGTLRPASAADYTGIRWQLKNTLRGGAVAFVRFRAVVK
jgi:uncharacterized repeat protein (TIGR01451 family)